MLVHVVLLSRVYQGSQTAPRLHKKGRSEPGLVQNAPVDNSASITSEGDGAHLACLFHRCWLSGDLPASAAQGLPGSLSLLAAPESTPKPVQGM